MRRFYPAFLGLFVSTCTALAFGAAASSAPRTVIDHDPMGVTIGMPAPIAVGGPAPTSGPQPTPIETVVANPYLNQILVAEPTLIFVSTGNWSKTSEQMRLECYSSQSRPGELIRLRRLREGARGDYSLVKRSVGISNGSAKFTIIFHKNILRVGHRLLSTRTVYIVAFKATEQHERDGGKFIQTVTVLSNDPKAFRDAKSEGK